MRLIHDIEAPMTVCGSGNPYRNIRGWCGQKDMQVSVEAFTDCPENHSDLLSGLFIRQEAIRIEGNSKYIIDLLEKMLDCVKASVEFSLKQCGPKRQTDCPNCSKHTDYPNGTHTEDCRLSKEPHD